MLILEEALKDDPYFDVNWIYDNMLCKTHYDQLQETVITLAKDLEELRKTPNSDIKEYLIPRAEVAVLEARIDCLWA